MDDLFSNPADNPCKDYLVIRDNPRFTEVKKSLNEMWPRYKNWADTNFQKELSTNFQQRFWEMYLGNTLLENGFKLLKREIQEGPDFHILKSGKDIWFEAVVPNSGMADDAVPPIEEFNFDTPISEEKIVLRFTNAIMEKYKKLLVYTSKGIIKNGDIFIIAINGRGIQLNMTEDPIPLILKAIYPVGDPIVNIDLLSNEKISENFELRFGIKKSSGTPIPTDTFLNDKFSGISGLLYSNVIFFELHNTPGSEFDLIDNHIAKNHFEKDWLKQGKYWKKDGNYLVMNRI
jgi:type I restriction enzyme S subunit